MIQDFNDLFYIYQSNSKMNLLSKMQSFIEYFLGKPYGFLDYFYPSIDPKDSNDIKNIVNADKIIDKKITFPKDLDPIAVKLFYLSNYDESQYLLDKFDCVTFVETILALMGIKFHNLFASYEFEKSFLNNLMAIRYKNSVPSFLKRNHFMAADWIPNNKNIMTDITGSMGSSIGVSTQDAVTTNNKINWLKKHKVMQDLKEYLGNCSLENNSNFEKHLKKYAKEFKSVDVVTKYLPLEQVLDNYKDLIDNIPDVTIIFIVRPNWNLLESIGTCLNISHLGICLKDREENQLKFYHATISEPKTVVGTNLNAYLKNCLNIPTIHGISIHELNYKKPSLEL